MAGEAVALYDCAVHAYVLMTNHLHLLVTPGSQQSLPRAMQALGRRYVRHVNAAQRRTGTLWEGRYRAAPVDSEAYFLACCRYIELNPVRAGIVLHAGDYRWSSYRAHAFGTADSLVRGHPLYRRLGRSPAERRRAYRALFGPTLDPGFVDQLRTATKADGRSVISASSGSWPRRSAGAPRPCRVDGTANPLTNPHQIYSDPYFRYSRPLFSLAILL
jgi:putative transposase